jgi:hypothetical protein
MGVDPLAHVADAFVGALMKTPSRTQAWIHSSPPRPACAITLTAGTVASTIAALALTAATQVAFRIDLPAFLSRRPASIGSD